jgi:arginine utilization regulatory protein
MQQIHMNIPHEPGPDLLRIHQLSSRRPLYADRLDERTIDLLEEWAAHLQDRDIVESYIQSYCVERRLSLKDAVADIEKLLIVRALHRAKFNLTRTARFLGVDSSTLVKKMQKYQVFLSSKNPEF